MLGPPPSSTLFPYTTLFRSLLMSSHLVIGKAGGASVQEAIAARCPMIVNQIIPGQEDGNARLDRKSTRLNSSHRCISYAVFCLKKKREPETIRSSISRPTPG